jgi:hypothetical protein
MSEFASAWLLKYKPGGCVAFPAHTTMGLVDRPAIRVVPGTPYYCPGLFQWEGRYLPLVDLNALLRAYPGETVPVIEHVLVLAWQPAPGKALAYGAVCAPHLVRKIEVDDSQQCPLPEDSDLWPWTALSCFRHEGRPVPVLDTARLFGQAHA